MATTTNPKERLDRHAERIAALEQEVYAKQADKEYFGNDAIWLIFLGVLAFASIAFVIMWIRA